MATRCGETEASRRAGFTLIEMLVAITIIVVLATITVAFLPTVANYERASKGAGQLQSWLLISKQRALRDQLPRGVRLLADPATGLARSAVYIEQPPDFDGGTISVATPDGINWVATGTNVDFTGGFSEEARFPVRNLDYLFFPGSANLCRIKRVTSPNTLELYNGAAVAETPTYDIIRNSRALAGESELQLPKDVVADLNNLFSLPDFDDRPPHDVVNDLVPYDILFSPSGAVIARDVTAGKIILWVRDSSRDAAQPGELLLVTVYARTGLIAVHPVNEPLNPDPLVRWQFTRDGRSSGM